MYDVLNLVILNAKIDAFKVHETILLKTQLKEVDFMANDILLLDRGYPSIGLLYELQHRNIGFCIQEKGNWFIEVNALLQKKETSKIVTFKLPQKDKNLLNTFKGQTDKVTVRIVVIELGDGKKEILCTSPTNAKEYTFDSLKQLYHFTWGIEETYKLFKVRADLESFSEMSALSVKQDFNAGIFSMNICRAISFPIEHKVREESKNVNIKCTKKCNKLA